MFGLAFQILSFFYIFMLPIIYFFKRRINTIENKIFSALIITNFLGVILDIISTSLALQHEMEFLLVFFSKFYLIYLLVWIGLLTLYIFAISLNSESFLAFLKKNFKVLLVMIIFIIGVILVLPLYNHIDGNIVYTYGPAATSSYIVSTICVLSWIVCMLKNLKQLKSKKYIPMFAYLTIGLVATVIQATNPSILIITAMETFITFLMYFTIENPDVKMINQLELAKEQAEKANRAKTDFLSSMSHEIRTPLNAIVGFSDCIMDAESLGEAKENAKDIVSASQTLLEIVNGILDISKIEAGKIEIVNSTYNARETFEELAKLITPKMNEKSLDFTYYIAPDIPDNLYGDQANLKKVITNLLSNASKYTDSGFVRYEVNCINTRDISKLIISVEDSGRGIKKENIDKMFTKFQRLDEDRNTTIEGTGLGLAITKQLVELMGGKIIVHTIYGEGSKFTVVVNQRIDKSIVKQSKKYKTTLDLHGIRILLVDDTSLNLKVATKLLQRFNADNVITCDSGFACLEKIQRGEQYDLILLDDMMPKMSGVETLKKLNEIPGFNTPTIALTANAITGMREKYLADGFDDYLAKPIDKDQLVQVINQILGRSITEEIDVPEITSTSEYKVPIRYNVVSVAELSKEEKDKIIPVENNIENELGSKLDLSERGENNTLELKPVEVDHIEEIETLEEDSNSMENIKTDLIPVMDINITEPLNKVQDIDSSVINNLSDTNVAKYDRSYLEDNGVDINHALELLGDMDMYNMTINDFMAEVESKWARINEYKNTNNMPDYAIEVHSLKSDCKYLGFMTLADIAYQHELKSKENDSSFVNEHFDELTNEYNKVLEIAKNYTEHNTVAS